MFHCAYVALLAAKQCSAELRLEVSEPHLNLPQRTKRWEFPEPDDDDYTEASWPPALPVSDETWKDFICKDENMIAAMQGSNADAGRLFKPERNSAQSEWTSVGTNVYLILVELTLMVRRATHMGLALLPRRRLVGHKLPR